MKVSEVVKLYAAAGYQLDPDLYGFLVQLPDVSVKRVPDRINALCPDTWIIGFGTLAKAIGAGVVVDSGWEVMLMIPEERFYFSLSPGQFCGLWEVL